MGVLLPATGARSDYFLEFKILSCATGEQGKVQVRDLVRVMGTVAHFDQRCRYSEKCRFIEAQGINGHRRRVPGAPSSGTSRESQAKFREGTMWGLYKGPVGIEFVGSVFGETSFYRENWGTKQGGSPCGLT